MASVDDILICAPDVSIFKHVKHVLDTLTSLGFQINHEKSCLEPGHVQDYLGYVIDTSGESVILKVPKTRIKKIRSDICRALSKETILARTLARIIGQCVATTKAVLPGKLKLRSAYRLPHTKSSWDSLLPWSAAAKSDFLWWIDAFDNWNGCILLPKPIDAQLITDASQVGWGAILNDKEAQGFWDSAIGSKHSSHWEMWAVLMASVAFRDHVTGKTIQVVSDNISTIAYLNHMGGPSHELIQIANAIWTEAINNHVSITCCHIAGKNNIASDRLSRLNDKYEWQLHPGLFNFLDTMWGPHTIDRFASLTTAQTEVFNTRYYHPRSSGVNALAQQDWTLHNNFVNAPFRLIPEILDILHVQEADATIIAPKWSAQPWFHRLCKATICPPIRIPTNHKAILCAWGRAEPLQNKKWKLYAWRVSGKRL